MMNFMFSQAQQLDAVYAHALNDTLEEIEEFSPGIFHEIIGNDRECFS